MDVHVSQRTVGFLIDGIMTNHLLLPRAGKERITVQVTADPAFSTEAEVDVQLDGSTTWYTASIESTSPLVVSFLAAGPDANQVGALSVTASSTFRLRVLDAGETVIRSGGYIALGD